jgi:hypothetical protein
LFRESPLPRLLISSVIGLAFAGCAVLAPTSESLDWNVGDFVLLGAEKTGWKGIRGDDTLRRVYIKRAETAERWTEKAEVTEWPIAVTLGGRFSWNAESVMNADKASMRKQGCSTDNWTVIQKDEASILYEWRNISCPGFFHQHAIVRIVMGRWYLWFISYGIKDKTLPADERRALIENLLTATVVHN